MSPSPPQGAKQRDGPLRARILIAAWRQHGQSSTIGTTAPMWRSARNQTPPPPHTHTHTHTHTPPPPGAGASGEPVTSVSISHMRVDMLSWRKTAGGHLLKRICKRQTVVGKVRIGATDSSSATSPRRSKIKGSFSLSHKWLTHIRLV